MPSCSRFGDAAELNDQRGICNVEEAMAIRMLVLPFVQACNRIEVEVEVEAFA